jgi:hypothetical protein
MVKLGTLKDYSQAKKKLKDAGIEFTETSGELARQVLDTDGKEIVSIARLNASSWVFRYNDQYFKEAI